MKALITIKAYKRPIYLLKVLKALKKCNNVDNYDIVLVCDGAETIIQQQNLEAAKLSGLKFYDILGHSHTHGCFVNTKFCLDYTFSKGYDYAIHLEDDTLPSKYTLDYFQQVLPRLNDNNLFAACTFHRPCHPGHYETYNNTTGLVAKEWFDGTGGFGMTKETYKEINKIGMFGVDYITPKGRTYACKGEDWLNEINRIDKGPGSFVWPFHKYFSKGKKTLFPAVSVVQNIGKYGQHIRDEESYEKMHKNNLWLGAFQNVPDKLYWQVNNIISDNRKFIEDGIE